MSEKGLLCCGEMVRAFLDERKIQTRRVIKPQPKACNHAAYVEAEWNNEPSAFICDEKDDGWYCHYCGNGCNPMGIGFKCPYGKVGDLLWVRESICHIGNMYDDSKEGDFALVEYKDGTQREIKFEDNPPSELWWGQTHNPVWKSPIYMPKWAARIWLEIIGIRVERVQEINEKDAMAEGVCPENLMEDESDGLGYQRYRFSFKNLWNKLNSKRGFGWEKNPWVWVLEVKKVRS